jgi:hypothetical protein
MGGQIDKYPCPALTTDIVVLTLAEDEADNSRKFSHLLLNEQRTSCQQG